jgi:putative polyketide hydroxylase
VGTEHTPVLVVGGGLAGLSTAVFLGLHGIASIVAERHPGTSREPKARGQMPPTMEALQVAGAAEAIAAAAPPGRRDMTIVIAESVTGRVLHSITEAAPDFGRFSPAMIGMAGQEQAEAILAARASEGGAQVRFLTRVESFTQGPDGVVANLRDLRTDETYQVQADYLVAADGHRGGIREAAGIGSHGRGVLGQATSLLFEAELDGVLDGAAVQMHYLQNPSLPGGSGVFVSTDTPGRYVAGVHPAETPTTEEAIEFIRVITGVPDLDVKLLDVTTWSTACRVADTFSTGRIHLVGDAAHVMPPTGGQGGNTAVMDGYHLAWRLAAVLHGTAGAGLLASYDIERRPYADFLVEQQYAYMVQRQAPHLADDTVAEIIDPTRVLFGYHYPAGAFIAEPGEGPPFDDPAAPSGRPGTRAPHVRLAGGGSTRDLYGRDFVLLTSDEDWQAAGAQVARRLGVAVTVHPMAPGEGDWEQAHRVGPAGAVLVRPDGLIAWRSMGSGEATDLESALRTILDR